MLPSEDQLGDALADVGLRCFRPLQQEAICAVCDKKDCLLVVATGMMFEFMHSSPRYGSIRSLGAWKELAVAIVT
jgi:hypothetical protein